MFSKLFKKSEKLRVEETLPKELLDIAYIASNKELAWKKKDIPFVLEELKKLNIAVEHGEVWITLGNGKWTGMVPNKNKQPDGIYHWEVDFKENESWEDYLNRSVAESLAAVANLQPENDTLEDIKDKLYYNILLLSKEQYRRERQGKFNSGKKHLIFGKEIITSINKLEKAGFPVKITIEGQYHQYKVSDEKYTLNVDINTNWLGLNFNVIDSTHRTLVNYSVDTDNYTIALPEYGNFAREIESSIVNFIDSLRKHKISIGTFNNYPAIAIEHESEYSIRYVKPALFGIMSEVCNTTIKTKKKLKKLGSFITI